MNTLIVSFEQMKSPELISFGKGVVDSMRDNEHFPQPWHNCPTSLDQLEQSIFTLEKADLAAKSGDHGKIADRIAQHKHLASRLYNVARFVEMVADGDPVKLRSSNFKLRKPPVRSNTQVHLPAPVLKVTHGEKSGTFIAKAKKVPGASSYHLQICTGDPTVHENWDHYDYVVLCSSILIQNPEPGKTYSFRLMAIGSNNTSAWSLPVTIMSL